MRTRLALRGHQESLLASAAPNRPVAARAHSGPGAASAVLSADFASLAILSPSERRMADIGVRAFERTLIESATPHGTSRGEPTIVRSGRASRILDAAGSAAAAVGRTIVLGGAAPSLSTAAGEALLHHELGHVRDNGDRPVVPGGLAADRGAAEARADGPAMATPSAGNETVVHFQGAGTVVVNVARRAVRWLAKRGANVSAHIAKRHVAKRLGKSTFKGSGKDVKKLLKRTIKNPDGVVDQGRRLVFEKTFGRDVGKGGEQVIRVVVDKATGKIVTAFPTLARIALTTAAVGIASGHASGADAEIKSRRAAIAKALEPSFLEEALDFVMGTSTVARDEDLLAEERIVQRAITDAIAGVEEEMEVSLDEEDRAAIREIILTEMETEPTAG